MAMLESAQQQSFALGDAVSRALMDPSSTRSSFAALSMPPDRQSREVIMLQIAHLLIHQGKATIYGGFLRDLVVRGEAPKDIDTRADSPAHLDTLVLLLKEFAAQNSEQISLQSCEVTANHLTRLTFIGTEGTFMVEITDPMHFPDEPTDLTSSDLRFCRAKGLRKKTKQEDKFPLSVLQRTIREKRFSVLNVQKLNDSQHGHLVRKAIAKMIARGWTLDES